MSGLIPSATVRADLAGVVSKIDPLNMGFVAARVLPLLPVDATRIEFQTLPREEWLKARKNVKRGERGETATGSFQWGRDTLDVAEYTFGVKIDVEYARNLTPAARDALDEKAAQFAAMVCLRQLEQDVQDLLFSIANFPTATAGKDVNATPWTNTSTGTPLDDIEEVRNEVRLASGGFRPNTVVMNHVNRRSLVAHPQFTAVFKGATTDVVSRQIADQQIASVLNIPSVIVPDAVLNSADDGLAQSNGEFWGNNYVMLAVTSEQDPSVVPQLGRIAYVDPVAPAEMGSEPLGFASLGGLPGVVDQYFEPGGKTKVVRFSGRWSPKIFNYEMAGHVYRPQG